MPFLASTEARALMVEDMRCLHYSPLTVTAFGINRSDSWKRVIRSETRSKKLVHREVILGASDCVDTCHRSSRRRTRHLGVQVLSVEVAG